VLKEQESKSVEKEKREKGQVGKGKTAGTIGLLLHWSLQGLGGSNPQNAKALEGKAWSDVVADFCVQPQILQSA